MIFFINIQIESSKYSAVFLLTYLRFIFDTINYLLLLSKLNSYEFHGNKWKRLMSYLSDKIQFNTSTEGIFSNWDYYYY